MSHPRADLVPYIRGELDAGAAERVRSHLAACTRCARACADFAAILGALREAVPPGPELHWGSWRAELRGKLDARRRSSDGWRRRAVPLAISVAAAAGILVFALHGTPERAPRDLAAVEETVLGDRLGLLQQYTIVERLDLLENLEVIRQLDGLAPQRDG